MSRLKALYEERVKLHEDSKGLLDVAEKEDRGLTTEEAATWDKMNARIEEIGGDVDRREKQAKREEWLSESRGRTTEPATSHTPEGSQGRDSQPVTIEFPAGKWGRAARTVELEPGTDLHRAAQSEYRQAFAEYAQTGRQAGLIVGDDTAAGYLAPTTLSTQIIKFVDDRVTMRQLANVLPPLARSVSLGAVSYDTDPGDADWTAEVPATALTEDTSMAFGKRELNPNLLSKLILASMKMLRTSVIPIESFIAERLGYKFAITENKTFLTGTGAHQPLGVFTASDDGIGTGRNITAASATVFKADEIIEVLGSLKEQYQANATILTHRNHVTTMRKFKTGDGQYLWQPGMATGQPNTIFGRPYVTDENAPSTSTATDYIMCVGDFRVGYWIVDSLQMEVQRLSELKALTNQIGFIGRKETDGMPVLAEAFARLILHA